MPDNLLDLSDETAEAKEPDRDEFPNQPEPYVPPSTAESVRRSGLAWSAGIVFFSSIAFMLFLGWIADLLFGSSPWGLVGGIVLGSIIGFVQFFRISSRIFDPEKNEKEMHPLLSREDDDPD